MLGKKQKITSVFMLAMINVAAICNIANLPITAQYGFASLFYYIVASLVFFIPVGLVSAELATGWPQAGGVYVWVREALGKTAGFTAVWLQWIENVVWYPTVLSFIATTLTYLFNPELAQNRIYIITMILGIFWGITFLNFLGIKISGWMSTICVLFGTLLPAALFILMGIIWLFLGNPSQIEFSLKTLIPKMNTPYDYALLAGLFFAFCGLEMSAVHAKEVEQPRKNYPKAIFLSALIIFVVLSMTALSIAIVVPKSNLQLGTGPIIAFQNFFLAYHLSWALPITAVLVIVGTLGQISTWIIGPSKGMMVTAQNGELPPFLQRTNKKSVPVAMLVVQAVIVTVLSFVFLLMPSISASYRLLLYLTAQLYLIMYILMFISVIVLRYKHPHTSRSFQLPFGKWGVWGISLIGIAGALFAYFSAFIPPADFSEIHIWYFELFLIVGGLLFCLLPILIHKLRKPHWLPPEGGK